MDSVVIVSAAVGCSLSLHEAPSDHNHLYKHRGLRFIVGDSNDFEALGFHGVKLRKV